MYKIHCSESPEVSAAGSSAASIPALSDIGVIIDDAGEGRRERLMERSRLRSGHLSLRVLTVLDIDCPIVVGGGRKLNSLDVAGNVSWEAFVGR